MQEQKNHGFISNYLYTMKMAKKSNVTIFVVIIMIGIVSFSLELLEVYTPKIILSLVEEKSTVNKFIMYVVAIGIAIIVFNIIFNFLIIFFLNILFSQKLIFLYLQIFFFHYFFFL